MCDTQHYKEIFDRYGGMMRTTQLAEEKVFYLQRQKLIEEGCIEKVRRGYYQWIDHEDFSETGTVIRLFPDAILCMDTALRYYGYSDRTPGDWHLAVSKDSGKSRFNIDYPFVKPYYIEPTVLELGLTRGNMDGYEIRIYDKDRVICDCLRYRNKMDKEIFNIRRIKSNTYQIYGESVERTFNLINISTDEGMMKLISYLRKIGVDDRLHEMGAKDGDIVTLCDFEFEYFE